MTSKDPKQKQDSKRPAGTSIKGGETLADSELEQVQGGGNFQYGNTVSFTYEDMTQINGDGLKPKLSPDQLRKLGRV